MRVGLRQQKGLLGRALALDAPILPRSPSLMAIESSKQGDMNVSEAPEGGDFFGQTVLVAGGGGIVGSAVVARVLREGGTVFAPVRSERSVEKLRELLEGGRVPLQRLKAFVADYGSKPGALRLVNFLNTHAQRGLNHVISIHGEKHESAKLAGATAGSRRHNHSHRR